MKPAHWRVLAILIGGHLLVDATLPRALNSGNFQPAHAWAFMLLGVCISQVNLIAAWAVFAPGAVAWRWPWAALWGTLMWGALVVGNRFTFIAMANLGELSRGAALLLGGVILSGIMAAQVPLWIFRWLLGYRLMPPHSAHLDERQFNIRQLLTGIAVLAVALAVGRLLLPAAGQPYANDEDALALILPIVGLVNLLLTLPCMWLALTRRITEIIPLAALLAFYVGLLSLAELVVVNQFLGTADNWEPFLRVLAVNFGQAISIAVTFALLQWTGFRWEPLARSPAHEALVIAEFADRRTLQAPALPESPHPLDS
jgi:hypothetical protein